MTFRSTAALVLAAVLVASASGCGGDGDAGSDSSKPLLVATTTHVGDLVRNVAGNRAEVRQLLRPGADPHDYEPRPSDARTVSGANAVFRSGGELDGWLGDLLESAGSNSPTVSLIDTVRVRGDDPHWWQDPRNAMRAVTTVRDELARVDPGGRGTYERNAAAYRRRLRRLDRAVARCIAAVPPQKRKLVTTHDALGYFAARYGIEVIGALIPSLSSEAQPSAGDTARLVEQIRREGVEAIFPESSLNPKLERAVARDAGAEVGGELWADTLGDEGSGGATYVEATASNTETLVAGFTGGRRSCRPQT